MKNKLLLGFARWFITLYCKTWRYKYDNKEAHLPLSGGDKRIVFAVWHDQLLPLTFYFRHQHKGTIASQSKDGEIIANILEYWGYKVARGSSSRGAVRALVAARKLMQQGYDIAFTVDGPKGPRHQVKSGAVYLAKQTGSPIVISLFNCKSYKRFKSWDRFILPLPFARVNMYMMSAIQLDGDLSEEAVERDRLMLEKIMLEYTHEYSPDFV